MASNLKKFLIDLNTQPELKKKYNADPGDTMDKAGLTAEEKQWVMSGNTAEIDKAIGNEYYSIVHIDIPKK